MRATWRILAVVPALMVAGAGCGGGEGGDEGGTASATTLSSFGEEGREIAQRNGCMSCHSVDGRDGVGPSWAGVFGTEVELDDGSTVIADEEYMTTAIVEPNAQIRAGYRGIMPQRELDPDDVAAIVQYLRELGPTEGAAS